ncbi:MAG TPA: hypothetical protein VKP67_13370 [Xanthobacteraceae bacterium]|nr:hypothetical protein [Xanthobacteraceae bacterium]
MPHSSLPEILTAAFTALEQSSLGAAARGSGWLYAVANVGHVLGAALLVGGIATFDIQVLRRAKNVGAIARAVTPVAAFGLALQVTSGTVLLAADAMPVGVNPAFQFKMGMFALGLINVAAFRWRFGSRLRAETPLDGAAVFAAVSLASWLSVLLAGRFIAYL